MHQPRWQEFLRKAHEWQFVIQIVLALLAGGWVSYLANQAGMHQYVIVFVFLGAVAFVTASWAYVAQEVRQNSLRRRLIPREFLFGKTTGEQENRQIIKFHLYNDTAIPLYVKFDELQCRIGDVHSQPDDALNRISIIPSHQDGPFISPFVLNAPDSNEAWVSAKARFGKSPEHLHYALEFEVTCRRTGPHKDSFLHAFLKLS